LTSEKTYKDLLSAPVNVTWEITRKCNLHCRHCLSADLMEQCEGELDLASCRRFIDELDRMDVFQINFGGGEPFLRSDFLDILDYAHARGITTCVSTNGTLVDETLAGRLAGMDYLYIQVSLDGATAATNDPIRGKGTFDRSISGLETLVRRGFPTHRLSTNTVVTAVNFREIIQIHELGRRYGVKTRLSRFRPSGNARRMWQEYHLDKEQLAELSAFLGAHKDVLTGDSFFSITAEDRRGLGLNMCGAAKMTCSVTPDGNVYPCAFLQEPRFRSGNITQESLEFIWHNAVSFRTLRELRIESCERCARFNICHGGCPAVAYFLTQSLSQADPECMAEFQKAGSGSG
jgi:mycofactocin biosynthetic radical S-adenosylmethionine protein MftC